MSQLVMGVEYAPRQTEAAAIVMVKAASVAKEPRPVTVTTRVKAKTKTTDVRVGVAMAIPRYFSIESLRFSAFVRKNIEGLFF
jgi:hypothetical protein